MSLRVGLGASQADLDVQGEIDFDFFEESDCSSSINKTPSVLENSNSLKSSDMKSAEYVENCLPPREVNLKEFDLNKKNIPESCSSQYFNKPVITVSCDDATGLVQKTTIETVIPTPFNYKDNKCGKSSPSPSSSRKSKRILSPRLKSKIFNDDNEISDDSSLSSMSESESDISSASDDSFDLNESDSMTDVTPLMSPYLCSSPMPSGKLSEKANEISSKELKKEGVKFPDDVEKKECPKCEAIDLQELLKAVKRLEMGQNLNSVCEEKCVKTPSVITQNAKSRKNMSFSNEEVRRIDNENQVLLKKIIAQQNRLKPRSGSAVRAVSSSAVNRQKHQRQIALENLALLKRLESTKASRDLSRVHLLKDYDRRSSGVLSRASSRSSKASSSQGSSCRSSNNSSGRSSAISMKSSNSSSMHSVSGVNKP